MTQTIMQIPITKPYFGPEELEAVQQPLKNGWVAQGPFVNQFEQKVAAFVQSQHAVATSCCTTAMHIAMASLELRPGDEVIVPAFTWITTANVVEYMGATPVFCDIDLTTFNIDVQQIESLITPKTVGIIPVHLFGLCADMQPIMEIAQKHNLWVVEDAACAFGSWYQNKHAGTFGVMGCFSFHPRKSITTGEGGMLVTEHERYDQLGRILRDHGASRTDYLRHQEKQAFLLAEYNHLGYNFRMTDIQAAVGCVQMDRAPWILQQRTRLCRRYNELLADIEWIKTPHVPPNCVHGYQVYVSLFCPEEPSLNNVVSLHRQRNQLMSRLEEQGIATRQGTHAPAFQGYYVDKYGIKPERYPNAYMAERISLMLPLYVQMTEEEQGYVVEALRCSEMWQETYNHEN